MEIFINVRPYQTRIAMTEKGRLKQIFYHRDKTPSQVGALYKGRVAKINKSLNFAFVDLGLERSGFLYGKDLAGKTKEISKVLKLNQDILVQIKTDPIRKKGVRLSQEISLAGLFLVYIPQQRNKLNVSRQIKKIEDRERLTKLLKNSKTKGALILRTLATEQKESDIIKELDQLKTNWENLKQKFKEQNTLGQLQEGEDPLLRFLKDSLSFDPKLFLVDEKNTFKKIINWLKLFRPDLAEKVELYKQKEALFEKYHLESQVQKASQKKVSLKGGGFLIFEELEAFTVIDVNSGRFTGQKNLADNLLQLNLEAAVKIAEQIQLRHLGGIILVDFVDMESSEDGEKVVSCLEQGLRGDKSHPKVFKMGELGMVQITRKRRENSLSHFMTKLCESCGGLGRKKTTPSLVVDLFLKVEKFAPGGLSLLRRIQKVKVLCHPEIKKYIEEKESESLEFFYKKLSLQLLLEPKATLKPENFRIEKV